MSNQIITLRDPAGVLFRLDGRIFRLIGEQGQDNLKLYHSTPPIKKLRESGQFVDVITVDPQRAKEILEHPALSLDLTFLTLMMYY